LDVRQEGHGSPLTQGRARFQPGLPACGDEIPDSIGIAHPFAGSARTERVRPDDDSDRDAMTRDGDLLAGEYALEDLREGRSRLADRHGAGHATKCTSLYNPEQP
jgi:hypothetical protein